MLMLKNKHSTVHIQVWVWIWVRAVTEVPGRPGPGIAWGSVQWLSAAAAPASFGGEAANPGAGAAEGRWNLCNLVLM